jgi:hypothetical protein
MEHKWELDMEKTRSPMLGDGFECTVYRCANCWCLRIYAGDMIELSMSGKGPV